MYKFIHICQKGGEGGQGVPHKKLLFVCLFLYELFADEPDIELNREASVDNGERAHPHCSQPTPKHKEAQGGNEK